MGKTMTMLKREWKQNKQGVLAGGIVGAGIATYLKTEGVSALMAIQETGVIDKVMTESAPIDIATAKFYFASIVIGMAAGFVIDKYSKWI